MLPEMAIADGSFELKRERHNAAYTRDGLGCATIASVEDTCIFIHARRTAFRSRKGFSDEDCCAAVSYVR